MVPADAKKRWCPFARKLFSDEDGAAGINRRSDRREVELTPCIAEECMAWRWHDRTKAVEKPQDTAALSGRARAARPISGFCGLAGAVGAA